MRLRNTTRKGTAEAGVALLISLFALLLICVVGVALIMASGTDTALTGNFTSATSVYYASLAGLEEGRARLLPKSPVNLGTAFGVGPGTAPALVAGVPQVWYIVNPLPGENVTPWDLGSAYPDTEFFQEFGFNPPLTAPGMQQTVSAAPLTPGPQGPMYTMYKWVRINPVTAASLAASSPVQVNGAGTQDTQLLYGNNRLNTDPAAAGCSAATCGVLEITALAAMPMPNGTMSQRMLQYIVAPTTLFSSTGMTFPAALTLDGNHVQFDAPITPPNLPQFLVNGTDAAPQGGCPPGANPMPAIGYTNAFDNSYTNIVGAIPLSASANYTGGVVVNAPNNIQSPNVGQVVLPSNWLAPSTLQAVAQNVAQNADIVQTSTPYSNATATGSLFQNAQAGWSQNPPIPVTVVVNGDLDLSGWAGTGYGILFVTGQLTLNSNANWNGLVMVVGKGLVDAPTGIGQINGAVLVARAFDPAGNLLPGNALGASWWRQSGGAGAINYSNCWVNFVQLPVSYKVLSFREIPLT